MANTTTEILTVDGVSLNTYAKNISSLAGRLRTPPVRTKNIVVPGRHGTLRPASRYYDENVITLPMWVKGSDDDNLVSTTRRRHFYSNIDALTELFGYHKSRLDIRHTLPDGTVRQNFAEVLEVIDIDTSDGSGEPLGVFPVTLSFNSPFWQDVADTTQNVNGAAAGITSLGSFAGMTAPLDDATIRFTGPINNPTIRAVYNGVVIPSIYATYQDNFGSGAWLEFDAETWDWTVGGGLGGFSYAKWAHSGGGRFFQLFPGLSAGSPQIEFTGGGSMTGTTQLRVTGKKKYLVG